MKLKFSFVLVLLALLFLLNGMFANFIIYFFCLICHEYSHFFVAKKLGYKINSVYLTPFGATICVDENIFYSNHEIIVSFAGPVFNFLVLILTIAMWWVFPQLYEFTYYFAQCNFVLCFFNLLPIYPLDGSKILSYFLKKKTKNIQKIIVIINITSSIIFVILFFIYKNFSLILMACLFLLSLCEKQTKYIPNSLFLTTNNNIMPVNTIVVNENVALYKLNKQLKSNCLNIFYVVNNNLRITRRINQNELYQIFSKNNSTTKIKDIM